MKLLLTTATVIGAFTVPAFAQDSGMDYATMTCADFMAMDTTQQSDAMMAMQTAMDTTGGAAGGDATGAASTDTAAADTATTGDAASTDMASTDTTAADAGSTDMAAADTAATGDAASSDMASTDTAAADAGSDMEVTDTQTTAATTDAAGTEDPMLASLMTACESDSTGLVMDAMQSAQGAMGTDAGTAAQ